MAFAAVSGSSRLGVACNVAARVANMWGERGQPLDLPGNRWSMEDAKVVIKWAEECLAWEYFAVVRQRSLKLPKVSKSEHTFDKGSFSADMLLVEIATGEIKGRYVMRITNSDKFTVLDSATEGEIQVAAEKDLAENITGVIGERLRGEITDMGS